MSDSRTVSAAVPGTHAQAVGWQVWVPCIGMALCSWLSFVDRQVLNILAPTIIKDTGLTNQDFTAATSFFFLTYTLGNPVWGTVIDYIGLRKGMLLAVAVWTAASMSHSVMASFAGFALAREGQALALTGRVARLLARVGADQRGGIGRDQLEPGLGDLAVQRGADIGRRGGALERSHGRAQ